jgi:hypothetical protein
MSTPLAAVIFILFAVMAPWQHGKNSQGTQELGSDDDARTWTRHLCD